MIIVSGAIHVDAAERAAYLEGCHPVIVAARAYEGCLDYHLSADPIDPGRINVYEQWESADAVEAFRGSGPPEEQRATIVDATVAEHEVSSSKRL